MQALLEADSKESLRTAVERHQAVLLTPDVIQSLAASAQQAEQAGQRDVAEFFAFLAGLLAACRERGIAAVFDELPG